MPGSYTDVDAIIAQESRVPVTFKVTATGAAAGEACSARKVSVRSAVQHPDAHMPSLVPTKHEQRARSMWPQHLRCLASRSMH